MSLNHPQLPRVDCSRGAPMGRISWAEDFSEPCRCFRLRFEGGAYDTGGAYWGFPADVYCATNGEGFRQFTRAASRAEAKAFFSSKHPAIRWVN